MTRARRTPEVGGGPPALTSGMVGTGSVSLEITEDAEQAGRRVQEEVAAQVRLLPDERAVRHLGRMARDLPDIVLRTPEFADGMELLSRRGEHGAITRIIGEARRGRRFEAQFYLVDLMDRVIDGENCSAAEAAKRVFARHRAELGKSARSIENDYSRFKRYYDLWRGPKYVSGQQLTRERWSP
jgi:hypothetical protein